MALSRLSKASRRERPEEASGPPIYSFTTRSRVETREGRRRGEEEEEEEEEEEDKRVESDSSRADSACLDKVGGWVGGWVDAAFLSFLPS